MIRHLENVIMITVVMIIIVIINSQQAVSHQLVLPDEHVSVP
jgi:hypothetical protein